jgi:alanyl-tRNA synthetase
MLEVDFDEIFTNMVKYKATNILGVNYLAYEVDFATKKHLKRICHVLESNYLGPNSISALVTSFNGKIWFCCHVGVDLIDRINEVKMTDYVHKMMRRYLIINKNGLLDDETVRLAYLTAAKKYVLENLKPLPVGPEYVHC